MVLRKSVGRAERTDLELISARCATTQKDQTECPAGHYAACSHILTGLCGLNMLQAGLITTGNIGDSEKAWGSVNKSSHVPVQSIHTISLLVPGGDRLRSFDGFREGSAPLVPCMA